MSGSGAMAAALVVAPAPALLPALFAPTPAAAKRCVEFFTVQINNGHTVAAFVEYLQGRHAAPTVSSTWPRSGCWSTGWSPATLS